MTNEELAARIRAGDKTAVEQLYRQNQGYLAQQARQLTERHDLMEDLIAEGFLAMLKAVEHFDPTLGNTFLTYAGHRVQAVMRDYLWHSFPVHFPKGRFHRLRRVAYLAARTKQEQMEKGYDPPQRKELVQVICKEMELSEAVAERLMDDYAALVRVTKGNGDQYREIGKENYSQSPERIYEKKLQLQCLKRILGGLSLQERKLVSCHLGIGSPSEAPMTFQELAIRLNYNDPSAAEKAFRRTVKKIRRELLDSEYGEYLAARQLLAQAQKEARRQA